MAIRVKDGKILKGKIKATVTDFAMSDEFQMGCELMEEIRRVAECDDFEIKVDIFTKVNHGIG